MDPNENNPEYIKYNRFKCEICGMRSPTEKSPCSGVKKCGFNSCTRYRSGISIVHTILDSHYYHDGTLFTFFYLIF